MQTKSKKKTFLAIGSAAACLCLAVMIMVGIFFGNQPITTNDLIFEHTDEFPSLFFAIRSKGEEKAPPSIWANPIRTGTFRTSITLGAHMDSVKNGDYIAVQVNFVTDDTDADAAMQTAYEFFKNEGFEAGILGDGLYLAATKAQLAAFLGKNFTDASVGAELVLANPTEAQRDVEDSIRY